MLCRDVALTFSLAVLFGGCSAVGGPPVNVGGGGSDKGGASSGSAGTGGSVAPPAGGTIAIPLSVGGTVATTSGMGGAGEDTSGVPPSEDDNCGSQTHNTSPQLVDIILVLDRSSSMLLSIAEDCYCDQATAKTGGTGSRVCSKTAGCTNRWTSVSTGIASAVASTPFLQWGLKFYSSPGKDVCGVTPEMEVGIPDGTGTAIRDKITSTTPGNHTPTAAGITAATNYLKGLADTNPKVILLATDGEPNCGNNGKDMYGDDTKGTKTAIETAFQAGIKTYVIGIGPSTGNLDGFAVAGHTDKHFPATSPEALNEALNAIGKDVVSCTFSLTDIPPDMTGVAVYLNKDLITRDDPDGWTFDPDSKAIELNGASCKKVKTERSSSVQVLFGCKVPPRKIP